jgi:hypothetical protein
MLQEAKTNARKRQQLVVIGVNNCGRIRKNSPEQGKKKSNLNLIPVPFPNNFTFRKS